jgi:hypothetical protein
MPKGISSEKDPMPKGISSEETFNKDLDYVE